MLRYAEVRCIIKPVADLVANFLDLRQDHRETSQLLAQYTAHILNDRVARPDGSDEVKIVEEQLPPGICEAKPLSGDREGLARRPADLSRGGEYPTTNESVCRV
jgi:hypothetical protein